MKPIERRTFLKLVGIGGGVAAAAALPSASALLTGSHSSVVIRAEAGMPSKPVSSMATHVLEGWLNPDAGTGKLTSTIFAGQPGATSNIAYPGLTRVIGVTGIETSGDVWRITGVVSDRSQLLPMENPFVNIVINRLDGTATAQLRGNDVALRLDSTT